MNLTMMISGVTDLTVNDKMNISGWVGRWSGNILYIHVHLYSMFWVCSMGHMYSTWDRTHVGTMKSKCLNICSISLIPVLKLVMKDKQPVLRAKYSAMSIASLNETRD